MNRITRIRLGGGLGIVIGSMIIFYFIYFENVYAVSYWWLIFGLTAGAMIILISIQGLLWGKTEFLISKEKEHDE